MEMRAVVWVMVAGCSGGKPSPVEDAKHAAPHGDATGAPMPARAAGHGDAQIRVEWKDVSAALRASPGSTPCTTPRRPSVAPSTTWGIPDVLVIVDGDPAAPAEAHVRLADCALVPQLAVGRTVAIDSAADHPVKLGMRPNGNLADPDRAEDSDARPAATAIELPVAGHTVTVAIPGDAIIQLATADAEPEVAYVAARGNVTDANGQVTVRGLATGVHAVIAWLPARGNQSSHLARGQVTVAADELATVTLSLGK